MMMEWIYYGNAMVKLMSMTHTCSGNDYKAARAEIIYVYFLPELVNMCVCKNVLCLDVSFGRRKWATLKKVCFMDDDNNNNNNKSSTTLVG